MALTEKSSSPASTNAIEQADLATVRHVATWRDHPLVSTLGKVGELGDQPELYAISAATIAFGLIRGNKRLARAGVRMLAAEWIATRAKNFVKHRVDRTRPHVPVDGGDYRMERGDSDQKALSSFPSGHTAGAVAVARAYASEYPEHAGKAAAFAVFVGAIQIPRCMHYPSDIGAGAIVGWAAGSLVAKKQAD